MNKAVRNAGIVAVVAGSLYLGIRALSGPPTTPTPSLPYNYCVDPVFYVRACEASPYSVASGTPGYVGQICGAHTVAYRGEDLFTYPIIDQGASGKGYARPPNTAPTAQAAWDLCFVSHSTSWPFGTGYHCDTVKPPGGTLLYHPIKWAQLPEPQKTSYGNLFHCFGTPSPVPSPVVTPGCVMVTVTPQTICVTPTVKP